MYEVDQVYKRDIERYKTKIDTIIINKEFYQQYSTQFTAKFAQLDTIFTYIKKIYEYVSIILINDEHFNAYLEASTLGLENSLKKVPKLWSMDGSIEMLCSVVL